MTKENGGKTVSRGVGSERRDAQLVGDFLQGIVTHTYHTTHCVRDGKHICRSLGIGEKECFRIAVIGIAPSLEDRKHLRGYHGTNDLGASVGAGGLGSEKANLSVDDVLVLEEKHIPEVDAVAQIREKPKVAVALPRGRTFVSDYLTNMIVRESKASRAAFRNYVFAAPERESRFLDQTCRCGFIQDAAKRFHIDAYCGYGFVLLLEKILERSEPGECQLTEQDVLTCESFDIFQSCTAAIVGVYPSLSVEFGHHRLKGGIQGLVNGFTHSGLQSLERE